MDPHAVYKSLDGAESHELTSIAWMPKGQGGDETAKLLEQ
jgi:hypothetical protein